MADKSNTTSETTNQEPTCDLEKSDRPEKKMKKFQQKLAPIEIEEDKFLDALVKLYEKLDEIEERITELENKSTLTLEEKKQMAKKAEKLLEECCDCLP